MYPNLLSGDNQKEKENAIRLNGFAGPGPEGLHRFRRTFQLYIRN